MTALDTLSAYQRPEEQNCGDIGDVYRWQLMPFAV